MEIQGDYAMTEHVPNLRQGAGTGLFIRKMALMKRALAVALALICAGMPSHAQVDHSLQPGRVNQARSNKRTMTNQEVLTAANAAISRGDYEGYLAFCADNTDWTFEGEQRLIGKDAVRAYMKRTYLTPPVFTTEKLIAIDDHVIAMGIITLPNAQGQSTRYSYCDVWRFENGKMAALNAYVVEEKKL